MDLNELTKYYNQFKQFVFFNEVVKTFTNNPQIRSYSLSQVEELNSLCRLIESSNNRQDFHGRFFKNEVTIKHEDRKMIVFTLTALSLMIGRRPKIIFLPLNFLFSSMLFWREIYTTIPRSK
jgi:hypothetical protein